MLGKYFAHNILLITAKNKLHVGTRRGEEILDLQIQRDSFGFPTIYSSSLKRAIKSLSTLFMKLDKRSHNIIKLAII
jgi:CRISPR/Cas system CMR subunit Cmr4 (Cas7 group RAMP superfamily)